MWISKLILKIKTFSQTLGKLENEMQLNYYVTLLFIFVVFLLGQGSGEVGTKCSLAILWRTLMNEEIKRSI